MSKNNLKINLLICADSVKALDALIRQQIIRHRTILLQSDVIMHLAKECVELKKMAPIPFVWVNWKPRP